MAEKVENEPAKREEAEPKGWKVALVILLILLSAIVFFSRYYIGEDEKQFTLDVLEHPELYEGQEVTLLVTPSVVVSEYETREDYRIKAMGTITDPDAPYLYMNYDGLSLQFLCRTICRMTGTIEKMQVCTCSSSTMYPIRQEVIICENVYNGTCTDVRDSYYLNASDYDSIS